MTKPIRFEHLKPCIEWWGGMKRKGREKSKVAWYVSADEVKARAYNLDFKNPHVIAQNHEDPGQLLVELNKLEQQTVTLRNQLKAILQEALLG